MRGSSADTGPLAGDVEAKRAQVALAVVEARIATGVIEERRLSCFEQAYLLASRLRSRSGIDLRDARRRLERLGDLIKGEEDRLLPFERPLLDRLLQLSTPGW